MAPERHPPPLGEVFYARTFGVVSIALAGYLLYLTVQPLLVPIVWAIFIAFLLYPLHRRLTRQLRLPANASAALLTLATFLVLVGPLTALGAAFAAQVGTLLEFLQRFVATQMPAGADDISRMPMLRSALFWLQDTLGVSASQLREWIDQGAKSLLQFLAPLGGKIFLGAVGRAVVFTVTLFMLFFFIRDGKRMLMTVRALIPLSRRDKSRLLNHLGSVTRAVVYGTWVTAMVQGILVGVGFALVGLPAPIVFGVMALLAALVPAAGTPLVWAPAVVALAAQDRWGGAIFMLGWGLVVTTVDNVLRPILVSGQANIGTLPVFIGVLGGVLAFGTIGLLLGPFILALMFAVIRFSLEARHVSETEG